MAGIDGFYYRSSFERYKDLALINNDNPVELCDQLEKDTGVPVVLMDANDIDQNQLGKCSDFPLTDDEIQVLATEDFRLTEMMIGVTNICRRLMKTVGSISNRMENGIIGTFGEGGKQRKISLGMKND